MRGAGGSAGEPEDGEPGVEDEEHQKGAQWHPLRVPGDDDDDDENIPHEIVANKKIMWQLQDFNSSFKTSQPRTLPTALQMNFYRQD